MKLPETITKVCSPSGVARLAGKGTGYVVWSFRAATGSAKRLLVRVPVPRVSFPRLFQRAPQSFEATLRQAIVAEAKRTGRSLSEKEIDSLVTKIFTLLEKVFSGELGVEAIPVATQLLRSSNALTDFLTPLLQSAGPISEARLEMLKQILIQNIQLQKEPEEEVATEKESVKEETTVEETPNG